MYLIFDTETTGLPKRFDAPLSDTDNWPRCVQIAWQLHDEKGQVISHQDFVVKPDGYSIPFEAEKIHGISTLYAEKEGVLIEEVLNAFEELLKEEVFLVGHNIDFDCKIIGSEFYRVKGENPLEKLKTLDTCTEETANLCQLPGGKGGRFKLPTLQELYFFLFQENFIEAHNATADVEGTARCFLELLRSSKLTPEKLLKAFPESIDSIKKYNDSPFQLIGLTHKNLFKESERVKESSDEGNQLETKTAIDISHFPFVHLHNHSQYSVLQSTSKIENLVEKSVEYNMPAVALTDYGNLMGAFKFIKTVKKYNSTEKGKTQPLLPIIGCVLNVCEDHTNKTQKDNGYSVVFLAKNKKGYFNLSKMSSIANTEGFYYVPRIDRKIVEQYKENLIVLSGDVNGEIATKFLSIGEKQALDSFHWWKEVFSDDFYLEITRHGEQEEEKRVNEFLIGLSKKHNTSLIATNSTFYIEQKDSKAHDILLCIKNNEIEKTEIGKGRGKRFGLTNDEYYFKNQEEMSALFADVPQSIENITSVVEKIEFYDLESEVVLPQVAIPEKFVTAEISSKSQREKEEEYLKYLTYEGAKKVYKSITEEVKTRIDFELEIIAKTGYPSYFLIVYDIVTTSRKMGISVGPGRGSAAGSVVAYCLGIVRIDPMKYNLLFERFLNPDRVSLPDIDIDFDDERREELINYIREKYGKENVAQIVTYGFLKAKSAIRDTARVKELPIPEASKIANLIPFTLNLSMNSIFDLSTKGKLESHKDIRSTDIQKLRTLVEISNKEDLEAETVNIARKIEGSLRNTGTHACGLIIAPETISNLIPITRKKDSETDIQTQFDNEVVESAGLLKIDILGLKTLTIIRNAVEIVKQIRKVDLDIDNIPLDDTKTYSLFQKGETIAVFQYESEGMQKNLRELKPTVFEDLIAMNALFRPGPMDYIPSFIKRKNGKEPIHYDIPAMEKYLKETYGITVYQEQVMLLSQELAGFTKGEADTLRKAMGKKIKSMLDDLYPKFIEGGEKNGHPKEILDKIWKDWEAFAKYAFNKSHSTCYAYLGYQTAYLKANYPEEFMSAVLSNSMGKDLKIKSFFIQECQRMGINILPPDINESGFGFTVTNKKTIRYGLGAIKDLGKHLDSIIENREEDPYKSVFDLVKRNNSKSINKTALENLVKAGALDSFTNTHRAQYFVKQNEVSFIEKLIKYGDRYRKNKEFQQTSLFEGDNNIEEEALELPNAENWDNLEALKKEKEVIGTYISNHPMEDYKREYKWLKAFNLMHLNNDEGLQTFINKKMTIVGIIENIEENTNREGRRWAKFEVQDFSDTYKFIMFANDYAKYEHLIKKYEYIYMEVSVREGFVNKNTQIKGNPTIQYIKLERLSNAIYSFFKKITIGIDIHNFSDKNIETLNKVFNQYKGKDLEVFFELYDKETERQVKMYSRKQKLKINSRLYKLLEKERFEYYLSK